MKQYSPSSIERLKISYREKANDNQNQKGYHVYLSWFFIDFRYLNIFEKQEYLASVFKDMPSVSGIYLDDDECSYDSTDSPVHMKAACIQWRNSPEIIRESWRKRANFLNTLPVPGRLNNITGSRTIIEKQMIEAVYLDWKIYVANFDHQLKTHHGKNCHQWSIFWKRRGANLLADVQTFCD